MNRAERRFLLHCAEHYTKLGYTIGLAQGKKLIDTFELRQGASHLRSQAIHSHTRNWDGISVILKDIVCVDFDVSEVNISEPLPQTWTEKTQRGWHYFYRMPKDSNFYACQIGYRPHLDLLVYKKRSGQRQYGDTEIWYGHAVIAPSPNYQRKYPNETDLIPKDQLPMVPEWIRTALLLNPTVLVDSELNLFSVERRGVPF